MTELRSSVVYWQFAMAIRMMSSELLTFEYFQSPRIPAYLTFSWLLFRALNSGHCHTKHFWAGVTWQHFSAAPYVMNVSHLEPIEAAE